MDERPTFFFDVGDPWCWLGGERLGGRVVWEPVLASSVGIDPAADRGAVEAAAATQGLPPLRWPEPWPTDTALAMRAATFAKQTGRVVAFSLAAMRQAFLAGRDMAIEESVLIAAAACELHPRAVLAGVRTRTVETALTDASEHFRATGAEMLPAFVVGARVLAGPDAAAEVQGLIGMP